MINSNKFFILFSIILLTLAGCSDNDFKIYVELKDLRVLGLVSSDGVNKAEASPGQTVTITPWVSDLSESTQLSYSWQACIDPGLNFGVEPDCSSRPDATAISTGTVSTLNSANNFSGAADSFNINIPNDILDSALPIQKTNGLNYLVIYTLKNSAGHSVNSFKRIVVSDASKASKNTNPVINSVLANDTPLGAMTAAGVYNLKIDFPNSSLESYTIVNADGSTRSETEELQTTWFYTDGESKYYRTINADTTTYTAPSSPPGRDSFFIIVIRDNRGGIQIQKIITPIAF